MDQIEIKKEIEALRELGYNVRPAASPGFVYLIKSEFKKGVFKIYYRNRRRSSYDNNYSAISPAQIAQVDLSALKWEPLEECSAQTSPNKPHAKTEIPGMKEDKRWN